MALRPLRRALILLVAGAAASAVPAHALAQGAATAERVTLHVGEQRLVRVDGLKMFVVVDEQPADVVRSEGGLIVKGRAVGDTQIQVFTPSGMRVLIVVVAPAVARPAPPSDARVEAGAHGPLDSVWGANSYTLGIHQSSALGWYTNHALGFSGRVYGGEYHSDAAFTLGALGDRFSHGLLSWTSDRRDRTFQLGDTSALLPGSVLQSSLPLRGALVHAPLAKLGGDVFAGALPGQDYGDVRGLLAGARVESEFKAGANEELAAKISWGALGFSTADQPGAVGRKGLLGGFNAQLRHQKGFGLELRGAGSLSSAQGAGSSGAEYGAALDYGHSLGAYRLEYQGTGGRVYLPASHSDALPSQRLMLSGAHRFGTTFSATGSASYSQLEAEGQTFDAMTLSGGVQARASERTTVTFAARSSTTLLPVVVPGQPVTVGEAEEQRATVGVQQRLGAGSQALVEGGYVHSATGRTDSKGGTLYGAYTVGDAKTWEAGASAFGNLVHQSVLAENQPPLVLQGGLAANGRLIMGNVESYGGFSLQSSTAPGAGLGTSVNIGVRFMPTTAHRVSGSLNIGRQVQGGQWTEEVNLSYAYFFGDAVQAQPLFEWIARGEVRGTVCVDENGDGLCGADEPPLAGVALRLSDGQTTLTDDKGSYRFRSVKPGYYHLDVDESSLRQQGRLTTSSSAEFELPVRGTQQASFGLRRGCEIQGRIVNDLDLDGARSDDEPLVGGIRVRATGPDGVVRGQANALGVFSLSLRSCGEYTVALDAGSLPASTRATKAQAKVQPTPQETPTVELFVVAIRTIQGEVYADTNRNGVRDEGEAALGSVSVRWNRGEASTDAEGAFLFRRLPAGKCELSLVAESLPKGLVPGEPKVFEFGAEPQAIEGIRLPAVPAEAPAEIKRTPGDGKSRAPGSKAVRRRGP